MNKLSVRNGRAILNRPAISIPTLSDEPFRQKLLILYKQFFKLRNMLDQGERGREKYQNMLRRNFRHVSYYRRREMVLGSEVLGEVTETELVERIRNSLVFVFNSTVKSRDEAKRAVFYEDIKKLDTDTTEKKVLRTLLEMEYQKPSNIKYDFHYNWVISLNKELARYDEFMKTSKSGKGFRWKVPMEYIGFKQYETTLMRFNEAHKLCL